MIDGLRGTWYAHAETLAAPFAARTTVLCPFDRLIHNRRRAVELFRFDYKLEIHVPPAKREYGYYVLPVLDGDRLAAWLGASSVATASEPLRRRRAGSGTRRP